MPARIEMLKALLPKLSAKDSEFAASLISQYSRKGSLSERQWPWINTLIERASAADKPRETIGDLSGVLALFAKAKKHLKYPAIVLDVAGLGFIRVSIAGSASRNPGTLNITDLASYETRRYFGRVHLNGSFESRTANETLVSRLREFACDPVKVASEFGRLTGVCCFCHKPLTDERSTAVGYGKTCAAHWDMSWGAKPAEFAARAEFADNRASA